ncbi:MAG: hypothetical protein MJA29_14565 [Candidatus Omnitrophica bacterium]|nr:hypothetical protein [Candidatus Omnitrophota bacterium]
MRRIVCLVIFVSMLSLRTDLGAAPCYGTRLPLKGKFVAGTETYMVFKRYLEAGFGEMRSTQYFFKLSYGVFDWLSVDLKGGAGNIKQRPPTSDEVDYRSDFAGGYGYRLRLYDNGRAKAVFGFQHISVHPSSSKTGSSGDVRNKAILDDWQYSLLFSYKTAKCTPYLGTRWSRMDYIHRVEGDRKRRMSDLTRDIGLIAGIDIAINESVWLNLEGQFLDAEALSLSLNWEF